jgi:hypothetical protein
MFNYKGEPLYFTKSQANKILHSLINDEWWTYNWQGKETPALPHRKFQLEEFFIEQVHNVAGKVVKKYSTKYLRGSRPLYQWIEVQNPYNDYKASFLSWIYPSSALDHNTYKYFTKDYIEMLRAAF